MKFSGEGRRGEGVSCWRGGEESVGGVEGRVLEGSVEGVEEKCHGTSRGSNQVSVGGRG